MPTDPRGAAWFAVHDALPAYWSVGPVTFDPGRGSFSVTARSPHPGRGKMPVTVTGTGAAEIAALTDLGEGGDRPAVAMEHVQFHPGLLRLQSVPAVVALDFSSPSLTGGTSRLSTQTEDPRVTPEGSALFVLNSLQFNARSHEYSAFLGKARSQRGIARHRAAAQACARMIVSECPHLVATYRQSHQVRGAPRPVRVPAVPVSPSTSCG